MTDGVLWSPMPHGSLCAGTEERACPAPVVEGGEEEGGGLLLPALKERLGLTELGVL